LVAYGAALHANTAAQRALHPALIPPETELLIATAHTHGALGCKVNGAGGDGGSVAVLASASASQREAMHAAILAAVPHARRIAVRFSTDGFQITHRTE
jgi:D-glycero-alpha-D-manno-heptose-7-phosphate kinase